VVRQSLAGVAGAVGSLGFVVDLGLGFGKRTKVGEADAEGVLLGRIVREGVGFGVESARSMVEGADVLGQGSAQN
jgi:hypothetical protein